MKCKNDLSILQRVPITEKTIRDFFSKFKTNFSPLCNKKIIMVASHALLRQMMLRTLIALLLTLDESQKMNNNSTTG